VAIISRANTFASLMADVHSLSDAAFYYCLMSLPSIVASYGYLSSSDDVIAPVLTALSAAAERGNNLTSHVAAQISSALDTLMLGREYQLAISEETSILTSNLRFYVTTDYAVAIPAKYLAVPRSPGEILLGLEPATAVVQLSSNNIYDKVRVSLVESNINFHRVALYSVPLKVQIRTDGTTAKVSNGAARELSVYPLGSTEAVMVTTTLRNAPSQTFQTTYVKEKAYQCAARKVAYVVDAKCQFNATLKINCKANSTGSVYYTCPSRIVQPQCVAWGGEGYSADVPCKLVQYSAHNTTCRCNGSTGYDDRINSYAYLKEEIAVSTSVSYTGFLIRSANIVPESGETMKLVSENMILFNMHFKTFFVC